MDKLDVFFYEAFQEEAKALQSALNADVKAAFTSETIQESGHASAPSRFISIRTQSRVPRRWLDSLDGVLSRSTGFDHLLDLDLPSGYLPSYCARSVAEHAMLMWLSLMRKLPLQMRAFEGFRRDGLTGSECAGKKLLVVGVGHIGREVIRLGELLGMETMGIDIDPHFDEVNYVDPAAGIAAADIIVCAMNLTPSSRSYFSYDVLKRARKGVVFVNIARGESSPVRDLLRLYDEGHIAGIGLDVFNEESNLAIALRSGKTSEASDEAAAAIELALRPNVLMTPHNAFNTIESLARKADGSAKQVHHFLENGHFLWPVPSR